ncbi:MAG: NusG domain II-containing protein [bacterium]
MRSRELISRLTPADTVLLALLLALSLVSLFFVKDVLPQGSEVIIEVQGKQVYSLSLNEDRVQDVSGPRGITVIEIKDRRVRIAQSPCQNKICEKEGWIHHGVIVCLPNQVVVRAGTQADGPRSIDAITG